MIRWVCVGLNRGMVFGSRPNTCSSGRLSPIGEKGRTPASLETSENQEFAPLNLKTLLSCVAISATILKMLALSIHDSIMETRVTLAKSSRTRRLVLSANRSPMNSTMNGTAKTLASSFQILRMELGHNTWLTLGCVVKKAF